MDTLAAMEVFVRVVEQGGFSAAGRALGLAPSSMSRRVAELEADLAVTLLHRTTRRLSLTAAGETYYEKARTIVAAVAEARLAVTADRAAPSGILRLTVPASVARLHLATALAEFQCRHPAIKVAMSVTDRVADLVEEGWDLAIRIGALEDSSLIARKVGQGRRILCAAPNYLARAGAPDHPAELSDHACLTFRGHPGSNLWRFKKGAAESELRVSGPLFTESGEALAAAACAGLGLTLLPEWLVGPELTCGRLVEVMVDYRPDPEITPLFAVYPPGPYLAPKVRAFVDFLAERFGEAYDWSADSPFRSEAPPGS